MAGLRRRRAPWACNGSEGCAVGPVPCFDASGLRVIARSAFHRRATRSCGQHIGRAAVAEGAASSVSSSRTGCRGLPRSATAPGPPARRRGGPRSFGGSESVARGCPAPAPVRQALRALVAARPDAGRGLAAVLGRRTRDFDEHRDARGCGPTSGGSIRARGSPGVCVLPIRGSIPQDRAYLDSRPRHPPAAGPLPRRTASTYVSSSFMHESTSAAPGRKREGAWPHAPPLRSGRGGLHPVRFGGPARRVARPGIAQCVRGARPDAPPPARRLPRRGSPPDTIARRQETEDQNRTPQPNSAWLTPGTFRDHSSRDQEASADSSFSPSAAPSHRV